MKNRLNDEELVRKYLTTHHNQYVELLYRRYLHKVYRRCFSLTKDPTLAEDFTHDIFLRVFYNLPNFKERSTFSTWLYAIAYNYCMDQLRHAKRQTIVGLGDELLQSLTDGEDVDSVDLQLMHLATILDTMPPEETLLLRMKYQEDQDIKELASFLNVKDSAVKMRLKRSRDKIRHLYFKANQ